MFHHLILALSMGTATLGVPAPAAPPNALYCLRVEPITGTLIGGIKCLTREQWAEGDVDVDEVWARDGVRVIS